MMNSEIAMSSTLPQWWRITLIALATLTMCSCQSAMNLDGGASKSVVRGQSPESANRLSNRLPTHLTQAQMRKASAEIADAPIDLGCSCCGGGCRTRGCGGEKPGPKDEYLCDGGDHGLQAGVETDWQLRGLEQEDTIAHYDTIDGRTVVTPSNPVCIYAPRFGAIRRVVDLREYARIDAPEGAVQDLHLIEIDEQEGAAAWLAQTEPTIDRLNVPPSILRDRERAHIAERRRRVAVTLGRLKPYADIQVVATGLMNETQRALVGRSSLAAITWTDNQAAQVVIDKRTAHAAVGLRQPGVVYHLKDPTQPKLRLIKLASTDHAQPGDEVEFTLRFDNIGSQVMGNVTIVDNLTARLEYIEGSQKSTIKGDFKTTANEQGSLVVRWEILEPLPAGEGGVIQFRCRVR